MPNTILQNPNNTYVPPTQGMNPLLLTQLQQGGGGQPQQQQSGGLSIPNLPSGNILNKLTGSNPLNTLGGNLGFATTVPTYGPGISAVSGTLPWQTPGAVIPSSVAPSIPAGLQSTGTLGGSLTNATLSGTLGAAGLGGLAGNFLGKIGGSSTGGSIGGAAGAAIGNMILPGVGGFIGGGLGGVLGGFFGGGKPSNRLQVGGIEMVANEIDHNGAQKFSMTGKKFSAENAQVRDAFQGYANNFTKFLRDNGATWSGGNETLVMRFGDRSGFDYYFEDRDSGTKEQIIAGHESGFGRTEIQGFERNSMAMGQAMAQAIIERHDLPDNLKVKLENQDLTSLFFGTQIGNSQGSTGGVLARGFGVSPPMIDKARAKDRTFAGFLKDYEASQEPA